MTAGQPKTTTSRVPTGVVPVIERIESFLAGARCFPHLEEDRASIEALLAQVKARQASLEAPLRVLLLGGTGVGKSSLLNAVVPGLGLRTGEVSESSGRGRHTTTHAELVRLPEGGYVADTPGLRAFEMKGVEPRDLPLLYRDIAAFQGTCRFRDCSHRDEPGCSVIPAVQEGKIDEERYESYLKLRQELEAESATQKASRKR